MGRGKYLSFRRSKKGFIENGAVLLEESITLFHGRANPLHHFSVDDLNNMNVEYIPIKMSRPYFYKYYKGYWEGRIVLVKKSYFSFLGTFVFRDIVVATQMATHKNALRILGCCLETEQPVIVYEGMPIETLEDRIILSLLKNTLEDGSQNKGVLEWKDRLRIAWEISYALAYLHSAFPRPIILGNLHPQKVLLDQDTTAKLYDFEFARSIPEGENFVKGYVPRTSLCHLDPQYATSEMMAESTDVYALGMMLLVLLTGKSPFPALTSKEGLSRYLKFWVQNVIKGQCIDGILDPSIRNPMTTIEDLQLRATLQLALCCISDDPDHRPTMVEVATELKNMIRSPLSIPTTCTFQGRGIRKVFHGSKDNMMESKALMLEESFSLFHDIVNPIECFSIDQLNNMNVECCRFFGEFYQGLWEGKAVLVKVSRRWIEGLQCFDSIPRIRLCILREIVVATQVTSHNNIHKLIGCCLETVFPVLVYAWAAETLEDRISHQYQKQRELPPLEWKDRLRIAREVSHVVSNLHKAFPRPIIHMSIDPYNVLLDKDGSAKLSGFTRSVPIPEGEDFVVLENLERKFPSMILNDAPECQEHGKVAVCTDVYSFGLFILVLLTESYLGGTEGDDISLNEEEDNAKSTGTIDRVRKAIINKCVGRILDPAITRNGLTTIEELQLEASLQLAIRCVAKEDSRPTMEDVATELNNISGVVDTAV